MGLDIYSANDQEMECLRFYSDYRAVFVETFPSLWEDLYRGYAVDLSPSQMFQLCEAVMNKFGDMELMKMYFRADGKEHLNHKFYIA